MKKIGILFITLLTLLVLSACQKDASLYQEETYIPDMALESIYVEAFNREIIVKEASDGILKINYFTSEKEYFTKVVENKALSLVLEENKKWYDFISVDVELKKRQIIIEIPKDISYDLHIVTSNENIILDSISSNNLFLENNNGDINFNNLSCDNSLNLVIKNGNIQGSVYGGYEDWKIECTIKKGHTNLPTITNEGNKLLKVNCNNGYCNIDLI